MSMTAQRQFLSVIFLVLGLAAAAPARAQEDGVWVVTSQEAALPVSPTSKAARAITRGPAIRQVAPATAIAPNQPFPLKVEFAGRGGEKIDPASARITLLRGPNVNITPRLQPFLTANGIEIRNAKVPAGMHVLQVTVSDASGRQSIANVEIEAR